MLQCRGPACGPGYVSPPSSLLGTFWINFSLGSSTWWLPVPIEGVALQEKGMLCPPAHLVLQVKGAAAAGAGSGSAQGVFMKSHFLRGDLK